jgi:hypothetical protein
MIINGTHRITDDGGDYIVLTDYCEGFGSKQFKSAEEAVGYIAANNNGSPHTLVKLVRIELNETETK